MPLKILKNKIYYFLVDQFILTNEEISTLKNEFYQGEFAQDYDLIDEIVHRLKFFLRFKKPTRVQLLKSSRLIYLEPGMTLFKQGDYGDKMYVILKGAVNVVQKMRINDRQFQERVLSYTHKNIYIIF